MKEPKQIYQQRIADFKSSKKNVQKRLLVFSLFRLLVFGLTVFGIYQFWGNYKWVGGFVLLGIGLFVMLIHLFSNFKYQKKKLEALIEINEIEYKTNRSNFSFFPNGERYQNDQHAFSQDTDLFGERSFFQYLNRTQLPAGEKHLAFKLQENDIEAIPEKQELIKEVAEKIDFRQDFAAHAKLMKADEDVDKILSLLANYKSFVPKIMSWFPFLFSGISVLVIVSYFAEIISGTQFLLWFFIGLSCSAYFFKKVNKLSSFAGKAQSVFRQYAKLLELIEQNEFTSKKGKEIKASFIADEVQFSVYLIQFSKHIDALEQRNNMLLGIFLNGFLLWDIQKSYKIETWIKAHHLKVESAFQLIAEFDALLSLGNFRFNHADYVFPHIDAIATEQISVESAIHPLLEKKVAIANDFSLQTENFVILTGANMAGKSTFLRTLALQIVMANVGLPVRAKKCIYRPIKLITSMRTTDSLADESSYFYAELTRLKQIVDTLENEAHFVILDEILKGTNSTDKAIGAQKFVKRLLREKAVGIIATHDLSLCTLADESSSIENYYFDAEIVDDELFFDYRLKNGVCQNMNASFLLEKMGLV
jgi:DNA mismatch repair ATPase MutS